MSAGQESRRTHVRVHDCDVPTPIPLLTYKLCSKRFCWLLLVAVASRQKWVIDTGHLPAVGYVYAFVIVSIYIYIIYFSGQRSVSGGWRHRLCPYIVICAFIVYLCIYIYILIYLILQIYMYIICCLRIKNKKIKKGTSLASFICIYYHVPPRVTHARGQRHARTLA